MASSNPFLRYHEARGKFAGYDPKMGMTTELRGSGFVAPAFREAIELANDAVDLADFAQASLALLARVLGYDVAAIQVGVGRDRFAPLAVTGVDGKYLTRLKARWPVYASELTPLALSARTHGIAIDTDLDPVSRERSRYFQEIVAPQCGGSTLFCDLGLRGAKLGMFMIGRRSGFAEDDVKLLRALRPPFSLGVRSYVTEEFARATSSNSEPPLARMSAAIEERLTRREQEIVTYVCLGFTNPEIAVACGLSRHTVRNCLARIFARLGASTRAELVAIACAR